MKKIKIILIAIIGIFFCGLALSGKISGKKFDAEKWKTTNQNREENWSLRWDMMDSLRNNYELVGMSKIEITKLLGKPSEISKSDSFLYELGYTHTGINTGTLTITFVNGVVSKINVWQG